MNPEFLSEKAVVYSFGIGEDISFDEAVIENCNCQVFGFDPTPKSKAWVSARRMPGNFHFHDIGISDKSGFLDFYLPKNEANVSGSLVVQSNVSKENKVRVVVKSLKEIMQELGHDHVDVLKMDIEGSEYGVLENILTQDLPISQMLIEFHGRFYPDGILKTKAILKKMSSKGYKVFAVSDSFEEVSFIKTSLLKSA